MTLQAHDLVPHFTVTDVHGRHVAYRDVWQRQNLVLISSPPAAAGETTRFETLRADDTALVITGDSIPGLPQPGVLVADQWGEIHHVSSADALPDPGAVAEWLHYVRMQCPECQGEVK